MNFCLTSQCADKVLSKAQEIRLIENKDTKDIFDYIEKFPKAELIVPFPCTTPFEELRQYAKLNRIILAIKDFSYLKEIKEANIPWFYDMPVRTFFELKNLFRLGASYIVIDSPLFNNLDKVYEVLAPNIGLRLSPNVAYYGYIPAPNGICGSWIRPEDVPQLKKYNITFEFGDCEERPRKEEALYRVYSEGKWQGSLNNIITNLRYECDNELIPPDLIEKRINCGQRCQSGSSCHLCYRYLQIANREFINKVKNN